MDKKSQKDAFNNLFLGKFPEVSPQERFNKLLSILNSEPKTESQSFPFLTIPQTTDFDLSIAIYGLPLIASIKQRAKLLALNPIPINIMESGIFYDGGLKGWFLRNDQYESYPILHLDQFINDLSQALSQYKALISGYPLDFQARQFANIIENLKMFVMGVQIYKGRRAVQPINNLLRKLKIKANNLSEKPDTKRKTSKSQLKRYVMDIFCEHIKAPGTIIADRAAELLNVFSISASPEGMREYSKNK